MVKSEKMTMGFIWKKKGKKKTTTTTTQSQLLLYVFLKAQ
jgi:hypothetical protein